MVSYNSCWVLGDIWNLHVMSSPSRVFFLVIASLGKKIGDILIHFSVVILFRGGSWSDNDPDERWRFQHGDSIKVDADASSSLCVDAGNVRIILVLLILMNIFDRLIFSVVQAYFCLFFAEYILRPNRRNHSLLFLVAGNIRVF